MTPQRDETVGHMAGDEMTDDPIVVERHDEILGGPPDGDREVDDAVARDAAADDTPASDELTREEPASDELLGRHAAPEMGSAGLEQDPPPLVVPPGPAPADPAAPSGVTRPDTQAAVPEPEAPVTPGADPVNASPAGVTPVDANPADASPVATGPVRRRRPRRFGQRASRP